MHTFYKGKQVPSQIKLNQIKSKMLRLAFSYNCFNLLKYYWMIILVKSTTTVRDGFTERM